MQETNSLLDHIRDAVTDIAETKCSSQTTRTGLSCENAAILYSEGHSLRTIASMMTDSLKGSVEFTESDAGAYVKLHLANKSVTALSKTKVRQARRAVKGDGLDGGAFPAYQ